jgi:Fe-Mn family superoxide dismutase
MMEDNRLVSCSLVLVIVSCLIGVGHSSLISPPYYLINIKAEMYMLPLLQYNLTDLDPFIDNETLLEHYEIKHRNYQKTMNELLYNWRREEPENTLAFESIYEILRRIEEVPDRYQKKLRHNIGGFVNHALFWGTMSPTENNTERKPTGPFLTGLESTFLTYTWFKELFTARAVEHRGSGYVWLVRNRTAEDIQLFIVNTMNEDSPISMGLDPLLGLDVWEHAYFRTTTMEAPPF